MKKGKKKYLLAILLLVMFGFGSYVTYSIYRTSLTGNGSIDTAKWSVAVKKNAGTTAVQNLNFTAADITWTTHTGQNNTIAPGDVGYINYTIDATGSEVDVLYTASVGTVTNAPGTGFSVTADSTSGTITYGSTMTKTIKFTVTWSGNTSDADSKDTSDIAANDKTLSIPVTLTARQKLSTDA